MCHAVFQHLLARFIEGIVFEADSCQRGVVADQGGDHDSRCRTETILAGEVKRVNRVSAFDLLDGECKAIEIDLRRIQQEISACARGSAGLNENAREHLCQ